MVVPKVSPTAPKSSTQVFDTLLQEEFLKISSLSAADDARVKHFLMEHLDGFANFA